MKLVKYENYSLTISPEAFGIKAFRDLFNRDTSPDKHQAMLELTYIYFLCDPRSDYSFIVDVMERSNTIKEQEGLPEDWNPDEVVAAAIKVYEFMSQTSFSLLIDDTRKAIDKLRIFLRNVDLNGTDDKGRPKHTPQSIVSTVKQIPELVTKLAEAERVIAKELEAGAGRMRAKREKTPTEDGYQQVRDSINNGKPKDPS